MTPAELALQLVEIRRADRDLWSVWIVTTTADDDCEGPCVFIRNLWEERSADAFARGIVPVVQALLERGVRLAAEEAARQAGQTVAENTVLREGLAAELGRVTEASRPVAQGGMLPAEPRRVCLVGSSRFRDRFHEIGASLEKQGVLVLMMSFFQHADGVPVSVEERQVLRQVDRSRLDLASEVWVLNCKRPRCNEAGCGRWYEWEDTGGAFAWMVACSCPPSSVLLPYVGEDTRFEIEYAESRGKPVRYLEPQGLAADQVRVTEASRPLEREGEN